MPTAGWTHDVVLSDASAGTPSIGIMYARDPKGNRPFQVLDYPTLPGRFKTEGETTFADSPPEVQRIWYQETFQGGLGGQFYTDPFMLNKMSRVDGSIRRKMRLGPQITLTGLDAAPDVYRPTGYAVDGTNVWSFIGNYPYSLTYASNQFVRKTRPENAGKIYRNGTEYAGWVVAPAWDTTNYDAATYIWKLRADAQWTLATATVKTFKYFGKTVSSAGTATLWGANVSSTNPHHVYSTTDPSAGGTTWTGPTTIGQSDSPITGLVSYGPNLLVLKTNGLYVFDGTKVENLFTDWEAQPFTNNGYGAYSWQGQVLIPKGTGGLLILRESGDVDDHSFFRIAPDRTELHGRVIAIHGEPSRVFILVEDTTNLTYHVLFAEYLDIIGTPNRKQTDFRWHHLIGYIYTTGSVTNLGQLFYEAQPSGATIHNRLWIGVSSTGDSYTPWFLPFENDVNQAFSSGAAAAGVQAAAEFTTGIFDAGQPNVWKRAQKIDFEIANLGASGRQIVVKYSADGAADATLGTLDSTGSTQTLTFAAEVTFKQIVLKWYPTQTAATTTSPEMKSFRFVCQLRATTVHYLYIRAYLADHQTLLNGRLSTSSAKTDLAQLKTWNEGANEVTMVDASKTTRTVVFLPGKMKVTEKAFSKFRRPEYTVEMFLAEVG